MIVAALRAMFKMPMTCASQCVLMRYQKHSTLFRVLKMGHTVFHPPAWFAIVLVLGLSRWALLMRLHLSKQCLVKDFIERVVYKT